MKIYGIKCIISEWDGCNGLESSEHLLDYFFSTREKAEENLLEDVYSAGYRKRYEVAEIDLDRYTTKPEYLRKK